MSATVPPFTCPHSTYQASTEHGVITVYADGCRTTSEAHGPALFWCGPDEMGKPTGVSITEGGYLEESPTLDREPGFKTWYAVALDQDEVERVGRSLAALFGITLDETDGERS
jgi:hypothetical protein